MLIVVSKSSWRNGYDSILKIAEKVTEKGEKVAVLHIQDACVAATQIEHCRRLRDKGIDAYVLKADCEARGIEDKVNESVKMVDYKEWVALVMEQHSKIVSWT